MNNNTKPYGLAPLLVPAAVLLAPPAGAVEALLAVDSYVSASQSATNFGNAETLPVGGGSRALLRFDLASMLPAGTTAGQVSKAVLNVWVSSVAQAGSVEVAELLGTWTEPGVTGATLPNAGAAFATKAVSLSTAGRWVPIGVTSQVKKWLTDPTTNKGLLIAPAAAAPATAVTLDSKENTATSHAAWLDIELTGTLGGSYALTVGKNAGDSTGRGQLAVADFTTITAALNKIPNNLYSNGACSAHYLVKVLPGTYAERVTMKPCVDIEGSGELTTTITATGGATLNAASATVVGANQAELRFLTVENTGGGVNYAIGLYNYQTSPRLTHITATASGGSYNLGVVNYSASSPAMENVTASVSGGESNYGVYNHFSSSPAMSNITATGSGGTVSNYGVYNYNSASPAMTHVTATASGGTNNYGVRNTSASPSMTEVTATASGGTNNFGVSNESSFSPTMANVTATGSGGTGSNYGVYNYNSASPAMTNVIATASGGTNSYGVYNTNGSSPKMMVVTATASGGTNINTGVYNYNYNSISPRMTNVTATGSGGNYSYGVYNEYSSPIIEHSALSGATSSLYSFTLPGTGVDYVQVSASRLEGGEAVSSGAAANKCLFSYNGSFVALNASCQ